MNSTFNISLLELNKLKLNEQNPRIIKDDKWQKLLNSIKGFSTMTQLKPITVNEDFEIIAGNQRYRALVHLKKKKAPVQVFTRKMATEANKERKKHGLDPKTYEQFCQEFLIKDNTHFGQWNEDILANEWEVEDLNEWGLDRWQNEQEESEDYFETESAKDDQIEKPSASDDDHSVFELIMKHENKIILVETLDKVRSKYKYAKIETALMKIIKSHKI